MSLGLKQLVAILVLSYNLFAGSATPLQTTRPSKDAVLRDFLRSYVSNPLTPDDDTKYAYSTASLSGRKPREVIVYLMGPRWCGSGGCTALVLVPTESSYAIVTRITVTRLPIRVLNSQTNGWHDIAVWVEGGGISVGCEAQLRFNGKKYPSNPTIPPARHLRSHVPGKIVIPKSAKGTSLFK
jgi:hypothetical protein